MEPWILPLIILAAVTTIGYIRGRNANRRISASHTGEIEDVLHPRDKRYVNIGGTIGYNYTYELDPPFTEAKGTFTLLPRQSLLYLPLSLLISRHDRSYLHIYTDRKLIGEGHIIEAKYFPRVSGQITNLGEFLREEAEKDGKRFVLLWDGKPMEERLRTLLDSIEGAEFLRHFCCYRSNKTFFVHSIPKEGSTGKLLGSILGRLDGFMKNGSKSGTSSAE